MGNDGPDLLEVSDLFFLRKRFQSGVEINKLTLKKGEEPNSFFVGGFLLKTLIATFPDSGIPKDIINIVILPFEVDRNWFSIADIVKSIGETLMKDEQYEGPD